MRYAVDPVQLEELQRRWDEVAARLVAARDRLPEVGGVSGNALAPALDSLLVALRHCLGETARGADEVAQALTVAAASYEAADSVMEGAT